MDKTLPMQPSAAKAVGKKLKLRLLTGKHCRRKKKTFHSAKENARVQGMSFMAV